jgi:hypothetical protein
MIRLAMVSLLILSSWEISHSQLHTVRGVVFCADSGDTLVGTSILLPDKQMGLTTDAQGRFMLPIPGGSHTMVFSFIGYERLEKILSVEKDTDLYIGLSRLPVNLDEVTISYNPRSPVSRTEMGTVSRSMAEISRLPSFLGEVDVLRALQLFPGVQSAGDGNTGFFVRGGNADQNLVLFDNAVVYNPSHLFNFFSVFNPDAVSDLKLFKGVAPPSYGGRLSSVLDVTMKTGNSDKLRINGGVGLISSRLSVDGPMQEGGGSFLLAGRRTYADLFIRLSPDENQRNTRLHFYDLNAKFSLPVDAKNKILVSGYYGRDVTAFRDLFSFDWGNALGTVDWERSFSDRLKGNFSVMYSDYDFQIAGNSSPLSFIWNSSISNINLRSSFRYRPDNDRMITFGMDAIFHSIDPGVINSEIGGSPVSSGELSPSNALEFSMHASKSRKAWENRLEFEYGLRVSVFQVTGPGVQYNYDTSEQGYWYVANSTILEKDEFYDRFTGMEPRVSLSIATGRHSSVRAGYNRMTQFIQQAQSSHSIAPYDAWYMCSNNIPPLTADQVSVGFFRNLLHNRIENSIEFYYKESRNISDIIDNGDLLGNEHLESQLRTGRGWSYGCEVLLRGNISRMDGSVGYTWSRSLRHIDGINEGEPYFSPNDRRHDLALSGQIPLAGNWNLSANFIYSSGRPYTLPVGKMRYQGETAPIYSGRNSGNLPDYHRLDLSFIHIRSRPHHKFESVWNFSIFNVYGRINPMTVSFARKDVRSAPGSSYLYIPGPIPSVTWNFII